MNLRWLSLTVYTVAIAVLYVFMEWLFLVTKPSFMTTMETGERASVLAGGMLLGVLIAGSVLVPFQVFGWLARSDRSQRFGLALARVPMTLVSASLGFLLIDNFTYTVWGWGIQSTTSLASKGTYLLVLGLLAAAAYSLLGVWTRAEPAVATVWVRLSLLFPAACVIGALALFGSAPSSGEAPTWKGDDLETERRPNILLFSSDGIDADHVSAYGYSRRTTPAIDRLAASSLFLENNFPNAAHTGASITSILTGRLPTETGLIYPPDILKGQDAYRHLPAILKMNGYSTVSITLRHYADAYDLNLRGGFDESNFRTPGTYRAVGLLSGRLGHATTYFTEAMIDRLAGRLLHLTGRREMSDAFSEVTLAGSERGNDVQRIAGLTSFLENTQRPFFAHVHLMSTHGPWFAPGVPEFASSREQEEAWDVDFYDQAILLVDGYWARIEEKLRELGLWDDTVIVVFSDHGMEFATDVRTPLLFRFPGGAHARKVTNTTSNLDIAPTLLDYLGVAIPNWMSGYSVLEEDPDRRRPVLSAKRTRFGAEGTAVGWRIDPLQVGPPFYTLGSITAIVCQRVYRLRLDGRSRMRIRDVVGHSAACEGAKLPKADEVARFLIDHLRENGYDVSGLEVPVKKRYSGIRRWDR